MGRRGLALVFLAALGGIVALLSTGSEPDARATRRDSQAPAPAAPERAPPAPDPAEADEPEARESDAGANPPRRIETEGIHDARGTLIPGARLRIDTANGRTAYYFARRHGFQRGLDWAPAETATFVGIAGRVLDEDGQPVERGVVLARTEGEDTVVQHARIVKGGHFALYGLPEGRYRLSFKTDTWGSETTTLLGAGHVDGRNTGVTLQFMRGDTIEGVVFDEKGRPKRNVWMRCTSGSVLTGDTTDSQGRFLIKGLEAGQTYTLTVWIKGYAAEKRDVRAGTRDHRFQLVPK